jgi:colicin import membrane protein
MAQAARAERSSDRWLSLILSVLLHGALFAAIGYTWWTYKQDRPQPTLAIEASVVDAKSVPGIGKLPPQPEAPPPPAPPQPTPEAQPQVEPEGPPQPTPEELARRVQEQKEQAERESQAKQAEQAKQLELDRQREEQERQQEQALAEEKAAQEKREAEEKKAALDKAEAERKAAEAKKRAEEQQKAEQQANTEREADLRRSLNDEIRQEQLRSSGAMANWQSQITAAIRIRWEQPASARPGIVCVLDVTQLPGGTVTNVQIRSCNGDQAVRESIQTAAYKASPLPPPPDPSLFQRELLITFRPN